MYFVTNPNGRLVTSRLIAPLTKEEVLASIQCVHGIVQGQSRSIVFCVDLLHCEVFSRDVFDLYLGMMKVDNPALERTAYLLDPESPLIRMQMQRMIRDAAQASRKTFLDPGTLIEWLSEVLDPSEQKSLQSFLQNSQADFDSQV